MQVVRFSDLAVKEVINFGTGRCLGTFADCDMRIDPDTGKILEVILAGRSGSAAMFLTRSPVHVIPAGKPLCASVSRRHHNFPGG